LAENIRTGTSFHCSMMTNIVSYRVLRKLTFHIDNQLTVPFKLIDKAICHGSNNRDLLLINRHFGIFAEKILLHI